jgi:hypothetical protein
MRNSFNLLKAWVGFGCKNIALEISGENKMRKHSDSNEFFETKNPF